MRMADGSETPVLEKVGSYPIIVCALNRAPICLSVRDVQLSLMKERSAMKTIRTLLKAENTTLYWSGKQRETVSTCTDEEQGGVLLSVHLTSKQRHDSDGHCSKESKKNTVPNRTEMGNRKSSFYLLKRSSSKKRTVLKKNYFILLWKRCQKMAVKLSSSFQWNS